jgi:hypothetical protein
MLVKVEPAMFSQGSCGLILQYFGVHGVFVHDTTMSTWGDSVAYNPMLGLCTAFRPRSTGPIPVAARVVLYSIHFGHVLSMITSLSTLEIVSVDEV